MKDGSRCWTCGNAVWARRRPTSAQEFAFALGFCKPEHIVDRYFGTPACEAHCYERAGSNGLCPFHDLQLELTGTVHLDI